MTSIKCRCHLKHVIVYNDSPLLTINTPTNKIITSSVIAAAVKDVAGENRRITTIKRRLRRNTLSKLRIAVLEYFNSKSIAKYLQYILKFAIQYCEYLQYFQKYRRIIFFKWYALFVVPLRIHIN